jgi:hypothetical protein
MKSRKTRGWLLWPLLAVWLLGSGLAMAETRMWLDRDSLAEGESTTLLIETDQAGVSPDYTPLQADFILNGQRSSRQWQLANGQRFQKSLFEVSLTPRHAGVLVVPALRVGSERSAPLRLDVRAVAAPQRDANTMTFVETEVDATGPYVQQSVGVVVRLYFATQLASGELVLDTPAGASLQRIGEDRSSTREINGRRYNVVERRYLLIPERSGPLVLAGARFSGTGVGGFFDDFFGRDSGRLSARAPDQTLQVRAVPAAAPQPWLPLKELRLRYVAAPQSARVGEAVSFEVEAIATGATRAQFPELPVPSLGDTAQVFAEPPQYDETFSGSSPRLKLTRRYSIVPQQAGVLSLNGVQMAWWDVQAGQARTASVPDLQLQVAAGSPGLVAPPVVQPPAVSASQDSAVVTAPSPAENRWLWRGLAAGFALLWLLTLVWALLRKRPLAPPETAAALSSPAPGTRYSQADLRRALDAGGLEEVVHILLAMAGVDSLDALLAELEDADQRQALERMQRARWAGQGDIAQARARLREVFWQGPRWRVREVAEKPLLDPLYPQARGKRQL